MIKITFTFLTVLLLNLSLSAQNADIDLLKKIHVNRNQNLDKPFNFISESVYPISLATPIGLLGVGLIKHDKVLQKKGLVTLASLTISMGTTYVLKKIIDRERPAINYSFIQPVIIETNGSFPSGHTTAAFSTATSLTLAFPKWYVAVPAYTWASTVAYSRLHLGVHYPSDVLAGAVIGAGSAWLSHKANRWLQKRR
ncbi:phosphatase PAP2 family protein [Emticicia sp. SJ17W-69]|uniref:phosphatase PAP2 family protein n=1 Tax=Emticicia sp. SJ17W-69 TaxID=3421657 RepID=UPI003EBC2DEF